MLGLDKVISWLRAGYPNGIPDRDYVPLFAVLRRRLGEDEINRLGADLVEHGLVPADRIDVGTGYVRITDELPSVEELERVAAHLHRAGIDIDDPVWGSGGQLQG